MALAKIVDGTPVELEGGRQVPLPDNVWASWATVTVWTEAARNALGIWTIVEIADPVPADKVVASTGLTGTGPVSRTRTLADRPPPAEVDPLPFRLALRELGYYDAVVTWVAAQGGDIKDAWEAMKTVKRTSPLFAAAQAGLGLSEGQVDTLMRTAEAKAATL